MATRQATRLLQIIARLYYMTDDEIDALADDLLERRKDVWRSTLEEEARRHGCPNARANNPRRQDLRELRSLSTQDADSISSTWRRDVDRQLERLFDANPRGNRNYYAAQMERWARDRARWKNAQIALMTEVTVRAYARDRFRQMNGLRGGQYIYQGPPPVSETCQRRTADGVVDEAYVQTNPVPAHINCPHEWQPISPERIVCDEGWLG